MASPKRRRGREEGEDDARPRPPKQARNTAHTVVLHTGFHTVYLVVHDDFAAPEPGVVRCQVGGPAAPSSSAPSNWWPRGTAASSGIPPPDDNIWRTSDNPSEPDVFLRGGRVVMAPPPAEDPPPTETQRASRGPHADLLGSLLTEDHADVVGPGGWQVLVPAGLGDGAVLDEHVFVAIYLLLWGRFVWCVWTAVGVLPRTEAL